MFCFLFLVFVLFFLGADRANFFLNALVLYFYLEHVQRITFCHCFLIFNPAVFCVDDGVILWLKIKNPTTTTIGHILFRAFCYVVRACRIAGFCFLFVSNTYKNQSVSTIKHMHLILGRVIPKI